jgi:phenylpyruvate tautomerase PptA (4-oxalocrotonate tautomerase family)
MPMIDVWAAAGTFPDRHRLAQDLGAAVMRGEQVPDLELFRNKELTEIVVEAAGDLELAGRTWVLLTESPEGGWGVAGHANTGADLAQAARAEMAAAAGGDS